jgi:hypothetical protein
MKDFSVTQMLEPAVKLCRVDIRGPAFGTTQIYCYTFGRNHRVDVTLEISEDGEHFKEAGKLRGLSVDADFLPIEFEPTVVKKIRLTGTAEAYREDYNPSMLGDRRAGLDDPYFVWRLFAPEK